MHRRNANLHGYVHPSPPLRYVTLQRPRTAKQKLILPLPRPRNPWQRLRRGDLLVCSRSRSAESCSACTRRYSWRWRWSTPLLYSAIHRPSGSLGSTWSRWCWPADAAARGRCSGGRPCLSWLRRWGGCPMNWWREPRNWAWWREVRSMWEGRSPKHLRSLQ